MTTSAPQKGGRPAAQNRRPRTTNRRRPAQQRQGGPARKPEPRRTQSIGDVGLYSSSLEEKHAADADRRDERSRYALYGAGVAVVATIVMLMAGGPWVLAAAAAAAAAGFAYLERRTAAETREQARKAARGTKAEAEVATALRNAGCRLVINGAVTGRGLGDIDHVAVLLRGSGRGVLASVETKAGGGQVSFDRNAGVLLSGGDRQVRGNPVEQTLRHARDLEQATGLKAVPLLVLPGMANDPFQVGEVTVCGRKHLRRLLANELPVTAIDEHDVERIAREVSPRN